MGSSRSDGVASFRDPAVEMAEKAALALSAPAPPIPPPELTKAGLPLTKRQKKEVRSNDNLTFANILTSAQLKNRTAGPSWYDLPAPAEADLPRLHREVEALRLRNQLDPKRFYRKDEGEGKGIKGLPKYFAVSVIRFPLSSKFLSRVL